MQISEELIRQITSAVISQMSQAGASSESGSTAGTGDVSGSWSTSAGEVPSMAGRERINEEKTSYADYPRAKQGTDPKEVVIGVGAAFQREIKKTICGIPLDEVLRNVKAGIEEEGMIPRVVKILDTSDVCFMALEAAKLSGSGIGVGIIAFCMGRLVERKKWMKKYEEEKSEIKGKDKEVTKGHAGDR